MNTVSRYVGAAVAVVLSTVLARLAGQGDRTYPANDRSLFTGRDGR